VCRGSRLVPVAASGSPAVAHYRPRPVCPGELRAFAVQVLTIADDGIAAIDSFLQPELFGLFDLPPVLPSPAINP
jgi:RNA polymerase sigma-70 factor, ECF subfamily